MIEKSVAQKEKEKRENKLKQLAQKARDERVGIRRVVDGKFILYSILWYGNRDCVKLPILRVYYC